MKKTKEYEAAYRAKNKERLRQNRIRYEIKNKDRLKEMKRNWPSQRPEKQAEYSRRWYLKNPAQRVTNTLAQRFRRLQAKGRPYPVNGLCDICGEPSKVGRLHWDHDHNSGAFRGWLCRHCNLMLGYARDNQKYLAAAVVYLSNKELLS